jgi:hypothetical protein
VVLKKQVSHWWKQKTAALLQKTAPQRVRSFNDAEEPPTDKTSQKHSSQVDTAMVLGVFG